MQQMGQAAPSGPQQHAEQDATHAAGRGVHIDAHRCAAAAAMAATAISPEDRRAILSPVILWG